MSLHFLFRDEGHLRKSIADPGVVAAIKTMIAASVQGAHVLCVETLGFRHIYSKNEYHKVEDLKGVKIRVQATKTEDTHFPAYGAQTVHMPFGEVYTSLQTGVVQAAENGVNVYLSNKHYEVAPIMSMTEHEANNGFVWVSDKTWNSFSDEEKRWLKDSRYWVEGAEMRLTPQRPFERSARAPLPLAGPQRPSPRSSRISTRSIQIFSVVPVGTRE